MTTNGIETANGTETGIDIEIETGIGNGIETNVIEMTEGESRIVTNANAPASDGLPALHDLPLLRLSIHQHLLQRTRK